MRTRRVLVWVSALSLVVTAACSRDDEASSLATRDPQAAMSAAATRTAQAKTVRLSLTATSATKVKVLSGTGSYDFVNERGRFSLTTTLGAGADMLITPTDVYLKVPQQQQRAGEPTWIRLTESDLSKVASNGGAQFVDDIRQQMDPRSSLEALGSEVVDLETVGPVKVRGVNTTHLRGRVDLSDEAIGRASADKQRDLREKQKLFGSGGYPLDVYLDDLGRVRRVQYELPTKDSATGSATVVRFDLYDFGKAASIDLPKPSDVRDASTLTTTTTDGK